MALYTIGDLHLSEYSNKPMDIFGGVWRGYREKIIAAWQELISEEDTVVLCGDISWGMSLKESLLDFKLIDNLPGKKIVLKGNHDLWWDTVSKMKRFFFENEINTIDFLHNNCYFYNGTAICGSRGWAWEDGETHDDKVWNRELMRLEASLKAADGKCDEILCFLHYPPVVDRDEVSDFEKLIIKYGVKRCYYGHLHGLGLKKAFVGFKEGVDYKLVSADYLNFRPIMVIK